MAEPLVLYDVAGGVATITLNRPQLRNAFDFPTLEAFHARTAEAADDPAVRVIVVTGAGGHFCAGGDIREFGRFLGLDRVAASRFLKDLTLYFHSAVSTLARAQKPVLMAVDGTAAGGGFSLSLAGDVAVASDRALFQYSYTGIGLAPDGSSSYSLPRLVGTRKALWLAYTNPRLSAADALSLGLVNEVYPAAEFESRWRALAERLAHGATRAYAAAKNLFRTSLSADLEGQMEDEREAISRCARTADFAEGCRAFLEKRPPTFRGE